MIDVAREATALHEANICRIPIIAMVDTNCDPRGVDYVIPSNDDAIRAIKLMVAKIADAVIEGKALRHEGDIEEKFSVPDTLPEAVIRRRISDEGDLPDADLLGASTLAKLSPKVVDPEVLPEVEDDLEA